MGLITRLRMLVRWYRLTPAERAFIETAMQLDQRRRRITRTVAHWRAWVSLSDTTARRH